MPHAIVDILTLLGSLGLFLYGMKVMSDALMELGGERMRTILATTTSNRVYALFTGFLVTAAIQSSSATTLMVVSFVNAGLLNLTEAVGVIMGANIGSTVTAWLIAILGFKVKISALVLPMVGFGFLLSLAKRHRLRNWGMFIVGFSLLFIGLEFLKDSVPDISANPQVLSVLAEYSNQGYLSVLLFAAIGTLLTLIVQSSAATMALTLLMCHEGWIAYDMAAAMVLGENIGTTITANLAALVANYQAKRAARAHLLFNLMGVSWMLLLYYPFIQLIGQVIERLEGVSPFVSTAAIPVALSLFHTSFNILNALLLLGFVGMIVRLVERLVPAVAEPAAEIDEPKFLDEASLKFPQTAIKALFDESLRLLENTAYQVVVNGMSVHRAELESEREVDEIIASSQPMAIDVDRIYATRIKRIYGRILEYATQLQVKYPLEKEQVEAIRNLLVADRMLVQVVKQIKPLHENISRYRTSPNLTIRREYNLIRHRILKVIREIRRIRAADHPETQFQQLAEQRAKAQDLDVLRNGHIDKLIVSGEIDDDMASSLLNDSAGASQISQMLVDIASLLYIPQDRLLKVMDQLPGAGDVPETGSGAS